MRAFKSNRPAALVSALAALALLSTVAPAGATTRASLSGTTLQIVGGPERNNVSFGGNILSQRYVEDSGGIVAGPGCREVDPTKVVCPPFDSGPPDFTPTGLPDYTRAVVHLGGGDDSIIAGLVDARMTIFGEAGDDTVIAGDSKDAVYGGDGGDTLSGNTGDDVVDGGPGNDTVNGGSGNDTVIGGPGRDSVNGDGGSALEDGNDQIFISDGLLDQAQCGFGADIVRADSVDVVDRTMCEVVRRVAPAPLHVTAPSRVRISALLATGYRFSASFIRSGAFKAALSVTGSQARKLGIGRTTVNLASAQGRIGPAGRTVTLNVAQRYRAALRRAGQVSAGLRVAASGGAKSGTVARSVTLVR